MPRQPRLDIPGALHHIMIRGINKTDIFSDDRDRTRFLDTLGKHIIDSKCFVYAWALMKNHVHILFRSGENGISYVMRKVLTGYAQYFNRRHVRTGHLFENRYKSILCEEEKYLLALVRYIHLNPVRAGIVNDMRSLDRYPWAGHSTLVGQKRYDWMGTDYILAQFGKRKKSAQITYRRFIEEGFTMGQNKELIGGGLIRSLGGWSQVVSMTRKDQVIRSDERILGGNDFVNTILKEAEEKQIRQLKLKMSRRNIKSIIEEECAKRKVNPSELKYGGRRHKVSQTRDAIALRSILELGLSFAEIARHLGVSTSTISRAVERAETKIRDK